MRPLETLKNRSEFLALRQAPRQSTENFVMQGHVYSCETEQLRVGYTVTKKTGNSVERSRIKRRLRHAISEAARTEDKRLGGQIVLVARRNVLGEPYSSLVSKLTKNIDRLVAKGNKAG